MLLPRVSLADDLVVRCGWCLPASLGLLSSRLPHSALTMRCVSLQLDLPEYPSKEELKVKLQRELEEQAFGLA